MKHGRSDYNERIRDSAKIIPADEPVFLIRGQDLAGPAGVEAYALLAEIAGASKEVVDGCRLQAEAMKHWQKMHPSRTHVAGREFLRG